MMDKLRSAQHSIALKVVLGIIILSFVLTGVQGFLSSSGNYVAKVDGQEITNQQFEQAYQSERNNLQQRLGDNFNTLAADPKYLNMVRKDVLNRLIDDVLLDKYAKKLNLRVSDDQIKQSIVNMPEFQKDGRFDNAQYLELIQRAGFTPDSFSQYMRQQMVRQQLLSAFTATDFVLPKESEQTFALLTQERKVRQATLAVKPLEAKQTVTEQEEKAYYDANPTSFMSPEQVKVRYVELNAKALQDAVKIDDAAIAQYYQDNKSHFSQPERRKLSHILVSNEKAAQEIETELKQGADFATLAKTKSEDKFSGRNGGDLGWIEKGVMAPEFEQTAFALAAKGDISGIVKTQFGYHVIRLDDIQPAQVRPLSEVRDEVAKQLRQTKATDEFYALQQKASDKAFENPDSLDDVASATGLKIQETGLFSQQDVPAVLNFPALTKAIFSDDLIAGNSNSDVISVDDSHAFVVRVVEHKEEARKPFEQVSAEIAQLLKFQKAQVAARKQAEQLLTELRAGKGDEALKAAGVTFAAEETLQRNSPDQQLVNTVFGLAKPAEGKPAYGISENGEGDVVLVELLGVQSTPNPELEKIFAQQQLNADMTVTFEAMLASLRADADIKYGNMAETE
ncbi:peptidylprolyl isomerase [Plesiomonas shigelloides]|uniref:peptidylprolyl isomerase n=1 Tax=Plesiomonas shigelloides TaxID=703 RepID=UPI0012628713|nr:peptidylprolyl isomerase [Plesiomonas shigelloides]KAB7669681.1 peptidylprolyl isomerase [Plesiomonas shigelloides]